MAVVRAGPCMSISPSRNRSSSSDRVSTCVTKEDKDVRVYSPGQAGRAGQRGRAGHAGKETRKQAGETGRQGRQARHE